MQRPQGLRRPQVSTQERVVEIPKINWKETVVEVLALRQGGPAHGSTRDRSVQLLGGASVPNHYLRR